MKKRRTENRKWKVGGAIILLALVVSLLATSCSSNEHMYRHNRSHCDCPTF